MYNFFKSLVERARSDSGSSEIVTFLMVAPLLLVIIFSIFDGGAYFQDRGIMQGLAESGARSVAIMGGNGTSTTATPIEVEYGTSRSTACANLSNNPRVSNAYSDASTSIECNIMNGIAKSTGLTNATVQSVSCTPQITTSISENVSCKIDWSYGGLPISGLTWVNLGGHSSNTGNAESEVNLSNTQLVPRS